MIGPRDLGILIIGAVTAVSGVLAAVELNTLPAPPTAAAADGPAPLPAGTAPPVAPGADTGPLPSTIRDVLGSSAGAASVPLDRDVLVEYLPPSISEVLTERGAVLVVPPDTEVVP